jgi:hypothetical protein
MTYACPACKFMERISRLISTPAKQDLLHYWQFSSAQPASRFTQFFQIAMC